VFIQKSVHVGPFGSGPMFGRVFNGGPNWGFGISRVLIMFLFLLLVGAIAYCIIRYFDRAQGHHHLHVATTAGYVSADSAAADLLKMRFAKGEIDEDEFTRRMNLLKDHLTTS
jgi:putative membrane protein